MSLSARRGPIAAVLAVAVGLGCWWGLRSGATGVSSVASGTVDLSKADDPASGVRAPRHRESTEADAGAEDPSTETPAKPERLSVHVLSADDDAPIAGAEVRAEVYEGDEKRTVTATTDRGGVAGVMAYARCDGPDVFAAAPGFVRSGWQRKPFGIEAGDDHVTFRLEPAACLDGVVVDARSGAPLAGVRLVAEGAFDGQMHCFAREDPPYAEVVTAADGAFRLDGVPRTGESPVSVSVARHVAQRLDWNASKPRRIEFRLEPAGQIQGVVRDADGAPVEDVRVRVRRTRDGEIQYDSDAATDANGAYGIDGLPLGDHYDVWAVEQWYDPLRASAPACGIGVSAETPTAIQDLTLRRPAKLAIHVRDRGGAPVSGAVVWLKTDCISKGIRPSDAGDVEIVVAQPGRCRLAAVSPYFVPHVLDLDVAEGEARTVEIVMERGAALSGVVVDEAGAPIADARISAGRNDEAEWLKYSAGQETNSAQDGTFELTGCTTTAYRVSVSAAGHGGETIADVVAPKSGIRVVLATTRQSTIRFVLRGLPEGSKGANVRLSFESSEPDAPASQSVWWSSDESNDFAVEPGKYELVLSVDGFAPVVRPVELALGATVDLGEVAVDRGVAMHGRVVDSRGRGVAGARVTALVGAADAHPVAWTDASGAFRLFRLPAGDVAISVAADGLAPATFKRRAGVPPVELVLE